MKAVEAVVIRWGELLSIAATIQQQLYEWGLVEGDGV